MVIYKAIHALDAKALRSTMASKGEGKAGDHDKKSKIRLRLEEAAEAADAAAEPETWDYLDEFFEDVLEAERIRREEARQRHGKVLSNYEKGE